MDLLGLYSCKNKKYYQLFMINFQDLIFVNYSHSKPLLATLQRVWHLKKLMARHNWLGQS